MPVTPDAVPALRWIEALNERLTIRRSQVWALDSVSALAIMLGNATPLARRATLLMRSQRLISDLNQRLRVRDDNGIHVTPRPPVSLSFDACDLDAHQREGRRGVTDIPMPSTRITAAANALRKLALQHARSVMVLPTDFETTGATYTVPVIAPGWNAMLALSRIAETNHHIGLGILPIDKLAPSVARGVEHLLLCREWDLADVQRTFEQVAELHETMPGLWNGRDGIANLIGLALQTIEGNVATLTNLDARRRATRLKPRGLNPMLDALEDSGSRLGMRFAPRFDFGR